MTCSERQRRAPLAMMIVDDDHDHAVIIRTVLSMVAPEIEPQVYTDGVALYERLMAAPRGAAVLIDRMLGLRESYGLVQEITEARSDLSIAMLSAALSERDRERALEAGAVMAAEKPASIEGWRTLIGELIERATAKPATGGNGDEAVA